MNAKPPLITKKKLIIPKAMGIVKTIPKYPSQSTKKDKFPIFVPSTSPAPPSAICKRGRNMAKPKPSKIPTNKLRAAT